VNQNLGIKTALTKRETRTLRHLAAGRHVIEVGSLLGYSTIQMARTARHVDAIDPHNGYPFYNPSPTLPVFLFNLSRFGVWDKVTPHIATAQEVLRSISKGDLTFVDCTGFYTDTKFCLVHAKGLIACHDFGRRGCEGVEQAVLEFAQETGRKIGVVDTLAIL